MEFTMKTLLLSILLILTGSLFATIHIVNNLPNTDPDFTNLSLAHNAAAAGDTLYICGSVTSYGNFTLSKKLTLIGPGYFLGQNPYTQVNTETAKLGTITFGAGSSGSLMSGFHVTSKVDVNTNNITIMRNRLVGGPNYTISIGSGASNIAIIQNSVYYDSNSTYDGLLKVVGNNSGLLISNNILQSNESKNITIPNTSSALVEHNLFWGGSVTVANTVFQNNIMRTGTFVSTSNNTVLHNIGNSTQFGNSNGNMTNIDMNYVFTLSGSSDAIYTLAAGSPAIGGGLNGVDCGIFGGASPYVLSGMPEGIPSVYEFNAPASGFTFPIQVKARAH